MKAADIQKPAPGPTGPRAPALGLLAALLLASGCAHSHQESPTATGSHSDALLWPAAPGFLIGPLAALLTNGNGFSAQVEITGAAPGASSPITGQLHCRGSRLFFDPSANPAASKAERAARCSFMWDLALQRGFGVSDALQAWAPLTNGARIASLQWETGTNAQEQVLGHAVTLETATVKRTDGTQARFQAWRTRDLSGLPIRISTLDEAVVTTLSLSKIRPGPPPEELFSPPDGFSRYESFEALAIELVARLHPVKPIYHPEPGQYDHDGGMQNRPMR